MSNNKKKEKENPISKTEIKGDLVLDDVDRLSARFKKEGENEIQSNRRIHFDASVLPPDYEPEYYKVTGSYKYIIEVEDLCPNRKR